MQSVGRRGDQYDEKEIRRRETAARARSILFPPDLHDTMLSLVQLYNTNLAAEPPIAEVLKWGKGERKSEAVNWAQRLNDKKDEERLEEGG